MNCFKKYLTEFMGTFFLVFTVCALVLASSKGFVVAIAAGLILAAFVYAGAYISGGHYNPAVSLAAAVRGSLSFLNMLAYWVAQLLGGALAGFIALKTISNTTVITCPFSTAGLIFGEFLFTFALCYVVLCTATSEDSEGNSYFGFAIGSIVTVGILTVGGILCYAAFNPAIALGLGVIGSECPFMLLVTALINLLAGVIAALVFKITSNE